jgi:DNA-binding IclR family transcriptional regulator
MKAVAENYIIQTVSRALDLLEQFQVGDAELGITDLSNRLNLQKNNVFRLVATLKAKNYIEMNSSTGKYRLGIKTRALGQAATRLIDFTNLARPFLNELKQHCHETCYFSIIKDGYAYCLDGVESDLPVRVAQRVGSSRPLYCTAAGRVLLAYLEPLKQRDLLSDTEMKALTPRTITDPDVLLGELIRVAQQGYAIDDQEHDAGVMEIAAPVFDSHGVIIGALSILGPEMRLTGSRLKNELLPLVCQSAARLSSSLGYCRIEETLIQVRLQTTKPKRKTRKIEAASFSPDGVKNYC